jgi:hypothetical protein
MCMCWYAQYWCLYLELYNLGADVDIYICMYVCMDVCMDVRLGEVCVYVCICTWWMNRSNRSTGENGCTTRV